MQQLPTVTKPSYMITSVDHVLKLLQMLRDNGRLGLTQAAAELGVSPSTAHRMMAMLVYRGYAVQDINRRYVAGPAMSVPPVTIPWASELRDLCRPHLELLADRLDETVNLMVRIGSKVRFLFSVEGRSALRIGDRSGAVLDAFQASGGRRCSPRRISRRSSGSTGARRQVCPVCGWTTISTRGSSGSSRRSARSATR